MGSIEFTNTPDTDGTPGTVWHGPSSPNGAIQIMAVVDTPGQRPGPEDVTYEIAAWTECSEVEVDQTLAEIAAFKRKYPPHLVRPKHLPDRFAPPQAPNEDPEDIAGYWVGHQARVEGALFCEEFADVHDFDGIKYVVETPPNAQAMTFQELAKFVDRVNDFYRACASDRGDGETR